MMCRTGHSPMDLRDRSLTKGSVCVWGGEGSSPAIIPLHKKGGGAEQVLAWAKSFRPAII